MPTYYQPQTLYIKVTWQVTVSFNRREEKKTKAEKQVKENEGLTG